MFSALNQEGSEHYETGWFEIQNAGWLQTLDDPHASAYRLLGLQKLATTFNLNPFNFSPFHLKIHFSFKTTWLAWTSTRGRRRSSQSSCLYLSADLSV